MRVKNEDVKIMIRTKVLCILKDILHQHIMISVVSILIMNSSQHTV